MPRAKAENATAELTPEEIGNACVGVVNKYAKPNINARTMMSMPSFWAELAKALRGEAPPVEETTPVLTSFSPASAEKDSPDFTLSCIGTGFNETSVIVFAGVDEPTTLVSPTEVTTGVKPSLGWGTDVGIPVCIRNGEVYSNTADFTFTSVPEADTEDLPDDLTDTDTPHRKRRKRHD